jgi:hypothetical protein
LSSTPVTSIQLAIRTKNKLRVQEQTLRNAGVTKLFIQPWRYNDSEQ